MPSGGIVQPRIASVDGRLVVRYAAAVVALWIVLAVAGVVLGFAAVGAGNTEGGYLGLGLGAICTFVAWFAVRPVITADRNGLVIVPIFGSRWELGWSEVRSVGVRQVRAARGRGVALLVEASDDREVKVDGLWVGLTPAALEAMAAAVEGFRRNENVF